MALDRSSENPSDEPKSGTHHCEIEVDQLLDLGSISIFQILGRDKTPAQGVFAHGTGFEKLKEVIRPAGLGSNAGQLESPERLALHDGSRDTSIDIQVPHAELVAGFVDMGGGPGENSPG